jgi:GNAT superfamily N-acetyltransferase
MTGLRIKTLSGTAIGPWLADLARLRTTVFRAWPYLYAGDARYEAAYLGKYERCPLAAVVVAFDGPTPVGASTCLPLADEAENVIVPFRERGLDPAKFFYFGESVLLPAYRGRGAGVAFFEAREAHARRVSDAAFACFCAVIRPPDHPARPAGHVPLDEFWRHRGFVPYPDLTCTMTWADIGEDRETEKRLSFWIKPLSGDALP